MLNNSRNTKIIKTGLYTIKECPISLAFHKNGKHDTGHSLKPFDKVKIDVVFDRRIPGNIISMITTSDECTAKLKGDILDPEHPSKIKFI